MLSTIFIVFTIISNIDILIAINSEKISSECKYVSLSLPNKIKVNNQNYNTRYVMDDMYKRFAKKYHMSPNQMKYCLETKYKK
jgi:hypothetical protein